MAKLTVQGLSKGYEGHRVLDDLSFSVDDGEFLAVLGPSGCGKTTLLRLVAGFETADAGTIDIGDRRVFGAGRALAPEKRRVGVVFQSYALWPHMTVGENIAFGLEVARVGRKDRERRVDEALQVVGLEGSARRRPHTLSGGQRQRVALARCLVTEPSLVFLDEPLANLDVHLRQSLRQEFRAFHRRTGTTMVYITHDQAEAMELADRVAVLDAGRLLQIDTPQGLYERPAHESVARFLGEGMIRPALPLGPPASGTRRVQVLGFEFLARCGTEATPSDRVCVRERDLTPVAASEPGFNATVRRVLYQGGGYRFEGVAASHEESVLHWSTTNPGVRPGDRVRLSIRDAWVLPEKGV